MPQNNEKGRQILMLAAAMGNTQALALLMMLIR
jgi:hypothetical protein